MRRLISSLGLDGRTHMYGDGPAASFVAAMALCFMGFAVWGMIVLWDWSLWQPGVCLAISGAVTVYALSDFAVGRAKPVLVGAARAVALLVLWGTAALCLSYVASGDAVALVGLIFGAVAIVAFLYLMQLVVSRVWERLRR